MNGEQTRAAQRRGFTIVEILFAVLILGVLIALLIVGVRRATKSVKNTVDEAAVHSIVVAIVQFKKDFGFIPPIVDEIPVPITDTRAARIVPIPEPPPPQGPPPPPVFRRLKVYELGTAADLAKLQDEPSTFVTTDPFADKFRYSTSTLPVFLAGALSTSSRIADPPGVGLPIDGVKGPGFFPPRRDGSFDIPPEVRMGAANRSGRATSYEPLVNLGGSAMRVITDPAVPEKLSLVDRQGVPIRYYRWEPKTVTGDPILKNLRVPPMVARDPAAFPIPGTKPARDLTSNVEVRKAKFAVVAAGNNKVFGDEPIDYIKANLGINTASDEEARRLAEEDNIVEVGE